MICSPPRVGVRQCDRGRKPALLRFAEISARVKVMLLPKRLALLAALVLPGANVIVGAQPGESPLADPILQSPSTLDVEAADFDRDGQVDLVSLQGGDTPSIRVFYGDRD